jgi:hypothetical protein
LAYRTSIDEQSSGEQWEEDRAIVDGILYTIRGNKGNEVISIDDIQQSWLSDTFKWFGDMCREHLDRTPTQDLDTRRKLETCLNMIDKYLRLLCPKWLSERQHQLAKLIIEDRNGEEPTCSCCGEAINERDDIDMLY